MFCFSFHVVRAIELQVQHCAIPPDPRTSVQAPYIGCVAPKLGSKFRLFVRWDGVVADICRYTEASGM